MVLNTNRTCLAKVTSTSITPRDIHSTLARGTGQGTNLGSPPKRPKVQFLKSYCSSVFPNNFLV